MDSWIEDALPDAVAYATSLLGQRDLGEDVVQDCVCRLLRKRDHYDLNRDGRKLLFRSIYNASVNLHTRRRHHLVLDAQGHYDLQNGRGAVQSTGDSPVDSVLTEELRQAVAEGLQKLKLPYRSVLELSSLGHAPAEIAEILELDSKRVRVLLTRARKTLAGWLNQRFPTQ